MSTLFARTLNEHVLRTAWGRVQVNDGGPGADGVTIARFAEEAELRIRRLRKQVADGRYMAQPLRRLVLQRPGRTPRLLAVPSVRDRIVQTAATLVLGPELERGFDPASFAYRPGRGVLDAVEHVLRGRDQGFRWVVDADIHAFFDRIPHAELIARLRERLTDHSLIPLIEQWLSIPVIEDGEPVRVERGIAQGSPLSPLLANLYLDGFDRSIASPGQWLVRYADDFLIQCRSYDAAEQALEAASRWMTDNGLEISYTKTRIANFRDGFEFLGVRFEGDDVRACDPQAEPWVLPHRFRGQLSGGTRGAASVAGSAAPGKGAKEVAKASVKAPVGSARAVAAVPDGPASEEIAPIAGRRAAQAAPGAADGDGAERSPLLRTLHLTEAGNYLHKRGGRFVVGRSGEDRLEVPAAAIDQVCAASEGAVSFAALRAMLEQRIGFVLHASGGRSGWLAGADLGHLDLQRAQFRRESDAGFRLETARAIVLGKIANCRLVLRRYLRIRADRDEGADRSLEALQRAARAAASVDQLRGYEGQAAKLHFGALARLLAPAWTLAGRNRRPPADPVNALLSYGYAVLFHNVLTLLVRRGLHPCLGTLHAPRDGHAALASDLMEEFRPLVVDAVVLRMLLRGDLSPGDFECDEAAGLSVRLSSPARQRFIRALEAKLDSPLTHPSNGQALDFRRALEWQVGHYAEVVSGRCARYQAFTQR